MDYLGSAKVLWETIKPEEIVDAEQMCLYELFSLAFTGKTHNDTDNPIIIAIERLWKNEDKGILNNVIKDYREQIYKMTSPQVYFWGEISCAVARRIGDA